MLALIALIARWPLKNGLPDELAESLKTLADGYRDEPGTLWYSVNLPSPVPLDAERRAVQPPPTPIAPADQNEIVFFEIYRDAEALSDHIHGPVFTEFRKANLHHFVESEAKPGWVDSSVTFLDPQSSLLQSSFAGAIQSP
jgi:quinol monooxygenase YgiN